MKRIILAALLWFAATAGAFSQCAFSSPVPSNTIVGRLGVGPGPCQAIPFSVLASQLQTLGGIRSLTAPNSWLADNYFGSGVPWVDVKSGSHGCAAAAGNGTIDDTAAIQCQLNWMNTNLGGGVVFFPHGNFIVSGGGLVVKGGTFIQSSGRFVTSITSHSDSTTITFDSATCTRGAGMADTFVSGFINAGATQDNVVIGLNCPVTLSRNYIWGGHHGLNTAGVDGTYTDNFICGWTGDNVFSTGANWYYSNKLDTCANPSTANGFEQAASSLAIAENYFFRVDLSCGSCTNSIKINDGSGGQALSFFYGAITSSPIVVTNAKVTSFIGGELNSITGAGLINITGAYANPSITPSGGTYSCSANTNINCGPLSVGNGGTGNATQTAHSVLLGEGAAAQAFATIGTAGRLMVDEGSGTDPAFVAAGGDCSTSFSITVNFNCTKTNGVAFSAGATNSAAAEQARLSLTVLTSCITAVNFNSANTDHAIAFTLLTGFTRMIPFRVTIENASHTLVTATLGLFSATAGGGIAMIAAGTAITVSAATDATVNNTQTLGATSTAAFVGANLSPASTVQFRIGTAEGAAATADVCFDYWARP
jgi:hypothetical protein